MQEMTYTVDEIANMFKISKHTVYELIKRGELKAFKVGNKMRIEQIELERFKQLKASSPTANMEQTASARKNTYMLQLAGSHDFLVEYLVKYAASESVGLAIQPSYIGSLEGLMMVYRGSADIAAIHLLDPASQEYNLPFIRQLFVHESIMVIRLASREQGMIVAKGNPMHITKVEDMARKDVIIVNRQKGAGTRFLLDSFLAQKNITPDSVSGYSVEEWNHLSAASHVSRGSADVAFGIKYAANQLGLDFIPVTNEKFDLVLRITEENKAAIEHLLDLIHFTTFKESVQELEGYDARDLGEIIFDHKNRGIL
jgi:putative molybdopterin biosynthesis protein